MYVFTTIGFVHDYFISHCLFTMIRQAILETMTIAAVLSNSALVAFTGTFAIDHNWAGRGWIFFCMAFGIIL
jgi:hypothetical protein